MPCALPDGDVEGELQSACASTQRTFVDGRAFSGATVPRATEWSPPNVKTKFPRAWALTRASMSFRDPWPIWAAWRSGPATSCVVCMSTSPSSFTRQSNEETVSARPAARNSFGAFSTPPRGWPNCCGAPIDRHGARRGEGPRPRMLGGASWWHGSWFSSARRCVAMWLHRRASADLLGELRLESSWCRTAALGGGALRSSKSASDRYARNAPQPEHDSSKKLAPSAASAST